MTHADGLDRAALRDVVTAPERAAAFQSAGLWTDDTLAGRVAAWAEAAPDSLAVVDELGAGRHTYGQLRRDAAALAAGLSRRGLTPGAVACVQLPNRYTAVVAAVAVQSIGAVINPLLPSYRAREVAHAFATARPVVILTPLVHRGFEFGPMVEDAARVSGVDVVYVVDADEPGSAHATIAGCLAEADGELPLGVGDSGVSELIFTSGTEAQPKAIMHSERNANCAVRILFEDLGRDDERAVWMPSPVGHSTGFNYGIRSALYHGRPLVLQDRWDAAEAVDLLLGSGGTYTLAATTFLADLVTECERRGLRLDQLREFGCGGAPVPPELVRRADAVGIRVLRLYGSTEVLCATWNRPGDPLERRATTDGRALSHTEIAVRDDDGGPVAPGEPGELHIRSPQASVGFYADPERTASTYLADGWIRSGDIVTQDDAGHITVVGRKKEIIIRGGVNIAPREIEELVGALPEVERVAVVGLPDERLGERACACVVLAPGRALTLDELTDRLRAMGLAAYKLPERLEVLSELPTTPSGKVQKHVIRDRIAAAARADEPPDGELIGFAVHPLVGGTGAAVLLTLNRPAQLNAITWKMIGALDAVLDRAIAVSDLRAILITGAGRAFSAGGDLLAYQSLQRDPVAFPRFVAELHAAFGRLRELSVPVIALINGITAAGGLELLLNCDIALAAASARIGDAHLNFGQMGGGGVLTLLPRLVGIARATELVLSGRFLDAEEAREWGLVSRLVPDAELLAAGLELAATIAAKSPLAVANAKQVMTGIWADALPVATGLRWELDRNVRYCLTSEDAREGLAAFAEKRPPVFRGR